MNHLLFTGKMKMADVLMANHRLLLVLNRFRLHLGFGEKSVEEVCAAGGVSSPLFLMVCNVHTFGDYLPQAGDLRAISARSLLDYLQNSHLYYKGKCLPGIRCKMDALAERCKDLKVVYVLSDEEQPGCEKGFVSVELMKKYTDLTDHTFFLCGPPAMYEVIAKEMVRRNPACLEHPFYGEWVQGYASDRYAGENRVLLDTQWETAAPAQVLKNQLTYTGGGLKGEMILKRGNEA